MSFRLKAPSGISFPLSDLYVLGLRLEVRVSGSDRRWSYSAGFILCLVAGVALGVIFSLVALVLLLVRGGEPFQRVGVPFGSAIALYFVGFIAAGMIAGLLNPLARTQWYSE